MSRVPFLCVVVATACNDTTPAVEVHTPDQNPAIYGSDDRRDVYDTEADALAELARRSVVALVSADQLDISDPDNVVLLGPTLQESQTLCSGERFADQVVGAYCSGVLIDDDLVLTAGHCVEDGVCPVMRVVFDYYLDGPNELATISREDVFGCRAVVAREQTATFGQDEPPALPDYAVIQLDRPVGPDRQPLASISLQSIEAEEEVVMIGFPTGLPAKIDEGGRVRDATPEDFFRATVDAFGGNSGSPVFDSDGTLVGLLIAGQRDFDIDFDRGCQVPSTYSEADPFAESILYARVGVEGLCSTDWPSTLQCGTAPSCGDGLCSGSENASSCPADCPAPRCGDGVCGEGEVISCRTDCDPPLEWNQCSALFYGTSDGCDCQCGAPDPDCDGTAEVFGCASGQACVQDRCVDRDEEGVDPDEGGCASGGVPPALIFLCLLAIAARFHRRSRFQTTDDRTSVYAPITAERS